MKPSLVYEIILVILHVLTAVLVVSNASIVAKENANENNPIYSNNQDHMYTLIISLNKLANQSVSQMWKSETLKCVQCPQGCNNITEISPVQLKNASMRIIKSMSMTTRQSKKNTYMNIFSTSRISATSFKPKYSVYASIEAEVGIIVMTSTPQPNGVCKWFGQPEVHITFDACNFIFPTYRIPIKINCKSKFIKDQHYRPSYCRRHVKLRLASTNCYLQTKKKFVMSYDVAQKIKRNMDDKDNNVDFDK
ncbi:hypothetical protein RFI_00220 [Reticulomyxa filosa]|uniref:Uncharacterized protein n=1 Tax=Reticulomyxa filosa TaxID=46433 RepID=X6PFL6_RETFI|nr:hypothetical protein RFI_00220 [Reticulomyxa filosa]|eukprot:ETO36844.1 hypothetical protein RFI_00220 [Reticulomyxa filosa]